MPCKYRSVQHSYSMMASAIAQCFPACGSVDPWSPVSRPCWQMRQRTPHSRPTTGQVRRSGHQQHRQLLRPVRAEHQDSFDIAGTTWAGDERDEARIVRRVLLREQFVGRGEIGEELAATGDDDVMRWEYAQGSSTGA